MRPIQLALAASCCFGIASTTLAQAPGGGGDAVEKIEKGAAAPNISAKDQAQKTLGDKGWSPGYDSTKDRLIMIGSSVIAAGPDDPEDFGDARANAYEEAMLDAKKQMAEAMSIEISANLESSTASKKRKKKKDKKTAGNAPKQAPGTGEKLQMLANSYVDEALRGRNIDPEGATDAQIEEVVKEVKRSKSFSAGMKSAAMTELVGVFSYKIFEEVTSGDRGSIAVIAMSTPKSKQMAKAMLGLADAPSGKAKTSNFDYLNEEGDALIYAFGVRPRTDQNGELCLLAFGQSTADEDDDWAFEDAEAYAQDNAMMALRLYAGESVSCSRDSARNQTLKKFMDGSEEYLNDSHRRASIASVADALKLPGMTQIFSRKVYHELCDGVPTALVVYEYKYSSAKELAQLALEMGAIGGSKGGAGVSGVVAAEAAEAAASSEAGSRGGAIRGGGSGSSSAADDEDL
jgi:hypothetical protein